MSQLGWLEEGDFTRLDGLPFEDGPSDWHVNDKIMVGVGDDALKGLLGALSGVESDPDSTVKGYVLQRADASEEWLMLAVKGEEISHAAYVDGLSMTTDPEEFDASELAVLGVAEAQGGLDG